MTNIAQILADHARDFPDQVALVDRLGQQDRSITYAELNRKASRFASQLSGAGLSAGDTILLFHPMSIELYTALAAILRHGMTAMFIDPSAGRTHINRCCALRPPQGMIASTKAHLLRLVSPALRKVSVQFTMDRRMPLTRFLDASQLCGNDQPICDCRGNAPALVNFTSGSTGSPKATVRTHDFLLAQHRVIDSSLRLKPGDVELVTLPIFVLANLASRVTSVIADADLRRPGEIAPEPIVRQIQEHQTNRLAASPALLERVVEFCEQESLTLDGIDQVYTGGGPVTPRLLKRLETILPRASVTVVYGSTEAEPISTLATFEIDQEDRTAMCEGTGLLVGRPVESIDVQILRDSWGRRLGTLTPNEFDNLCLGQGDRGEIVVSGQHVLGSYLDGQHLDLNKFKVNQTIWHRTGDAGFFDRRGRLWLVGRCADRLDDVHGVLYPFGAEQIALQDPGVRQAAVVSHRGRRTLAVTLRNPSRTLDFVAMQNSLSFANIDAIQVLKRMPLDPRHNSKIDYSKLRQLLQ